MTVDKEKILKAGFLAFAGFALISFLFTLMPFASAAPTSSGVHLFRSLLGLIVFILISFALVWFLKQKMPVSAARRSLEISERLGLEPGAGLYLIKSEERRWLIGVSNKHMALIDRWESYSSEDLNEH